MKSFVCLSEVPGRETRYEFDPSGKWIRDSDLTYEINECDTYALEEALRLKESFGGEVTIVTVGPERAEKLIRKGLAMGADQAILIQDEEGRFNSPMAVASLLCAAIRNQEFDLILAGTQSDHYGYAQTGVLLAELMGLPYATIVMEIEAKPTEAKIKALCELESGRFSWVEMPLPGLLTIQAGSSQVRYPSLKGIMQARKKEIRRVPVEQLSVDLEALPSLEISKLYFPESNRKAELLKGATGEVVDALIAKLQNEVKVI